MDERREPGGEPVDEDDDGLGAEGGSDSPSSDKLPAMPADDDSPAGDTDQHSDA